MEQVHQHGQLWGMEALPIVVPYPQPGDYAVIGGGLQLR